MQLKWHLSHVRGYLELGMVAEAAAEFAEIDDRSRNRSEVLKVGLCVYQEQADWPKTRECAAELCRREPNNPAWWVTLGYATRRAESLAAAELVLRAAERLHPEDATIAFNLGCYACQRGELEQAARYVQKAIQLNSAFQEAAETDLDLAALRKRPI